MALLFRVEDILSSNRGQDARDTQGRDALATLKTTATAKGFGGATEGPETLGV